MLNITRRSILQGMVLFVFLLSSGLMAQRQDWHSMLKDPNVNFFDVVAAFEAEFPDKNFTKGSGWKKFYRWKNYYQDRIDKNGNLPNSQRFLEEVRAVKLAESAKNTVSGADWSEVGPIEKPANGTGQPNGNGRVSAVGFHPTDQNTIFLGTPSGGFWGTNDGGLNWTKRGETDVRLGVSCILVHPTNPDVIYIGTGDRDGYDAPGYGVWRSLDGGATFQPYNSGMGNPRVSDLRFHPANPLVILASTTNGHVYRTVDGGANWTRTFSGGEFTCYEIKLHPSNPDIVYVAGQNIHRSTDNGQTWTRVTEADGFTPDGHNRTALAVTPANPNVVYAASSGGNGFVGLYRSADGGLTWSLRSDSPNLNGIAEDGNDDRSQSWYDQVLVADPQDENAIFFGGVNLWKSTDGGSTWDISTHWVGSNFSGNYNAPSVHADHHVLAYSPLNGKLYNGNDGGIYITEDAGATWTERSEGLNIAQVYKIGISPTELGLAINGYQDNGTSLHSEAGGWITEIGGDGFECMFDPENPSYLYGSLYYGDLRRSSNGGNNFESIRGENVPDGPWSSPFTLDPDNAETMYLGTRGLWRSTNVRSNSPDWSLVSDFGDVTMRDIGISPANSDHLMASVSFSERLYRTTNATAEQPGWVDVSGNMPVQGTVKDIAYHPVDENIVYVAVGNSVLRTTDHGDTWTDLTGELPAISVNCLALDPANANGIYAGLDMGVYYLDLSDQTWSLYQDGLPNVEVTELEVYTDPVPPLSRLYAGTYGSGMWWTPLKLAAPAPPFAAFSLSGTVLCADNVIRLTDDSFLSPTSWSWSVTPNTVQFVNGTTSQSQNPEIAVPSGGVYTIELTASNENGPNTATQQVTIEIAEPVALPQENFEADNPNFTIINPDDNFTWEISNDVSTSGGMQSVTIDGYNNNNRGQLDHYQLAAVDATQATSLQMTFDVAYAPYGENFFDRLLVEVSTDCSENWESVYDKEDLELGTAGGYVQAEFFPEDNQWRSEFIDLSAYLGENVAVRLTAVNGYGNHLFVDNVVVSGQTALPIRLHSFAGEHVAGVGNALVWRMDEEEPDLTFHVQRYHERSASWLFVGDAVPADYRIEYGLTDFYPEFGDNLYRLELRQSGRVVDYSDVVEITTERNIRGVSMAPNPTKGRLRVRTESMADGLQELRVLDAMGRLLIQQTLQIRDGVQTHDLDLSRFQAGIYFVQIGEVTERILVK